MGRKAKAAAPQTPILVSKQIDYVKIIDDMNDVAFAFCMEYLYPVFNYQILEVEDVRRIDLKENLCRMQNAFKRDAKGKNSGFLNHYLSLIKLYLDDQLKCAEGSRAARAKVRAYEAIEKALEEVNKDNSLDIEDCVLIFVSLIREYVKQINAGESEPISNVTNELVLQDADTLTTVYNSGIKAMGGPVKLNIPIVKGLLQMDDKDMKVLYINSIIFLCAGLQSRGVF